VRRSPTPATPLHPPAAASTDPRTPVCVCGSQIQQLIRCMWAMCCVCVCVLKVLSRCPSSVEFHHFAHSRLRRGAEYLFILNKKNKKIKAPCWTHSDTITSRGGDSLPRRVSSPSSGRCGALQTGEEKKKRKNCPTAVWELFLSFSLSLPPDQQRQGSPRLSQIRGGRYTPGPTLNSVTQ